ncbi:MAG: undecaprenyl-diphosphate phosphatase, partial [Anaerolineales bacterium]
VFDVLVQVATLFAVIIYFWGDLTAIVIAFIRGIFHRKPFESDLSRLGWYLILATIPAGLVGVLFKGVLEDTFSNPVAAAVALFITAGLLVLAEKVGHRTRVLDQIGWKDALIMGIFQIFALFPGISRSGSTITGGMLRDFDRPTAARFSFLMAVPVMLAAGLVASIDLMSTPGWLTKLPVYAWGFLSSAVVGYLAIRWLLRYLTNHPLYVFSIYCTVLGVITLAFYAFSAI